jgi:cytochrome c peroxidase
MRRPSSSALPLLILILIPLALAAACAGGVDASADPEPEAGLEPDVPGDDTAVWLAAPTLPDELLSYEHDLPPHFMVAGVFDNTPADNPITDAGATLGRVLFYDKRLSKNGEVACGSCHRTDVAFADDEPLSEGFDGGLTGRHAMTLINVRYYQRGAMFWDERAATLEEQVLMPIQDRVEMGLTVDELLGRVAGADYYPALFEAAFGDDEVTEERISFALAQFVRSIVSYRSKWDEGVGQVQGDIAQPFPNFSEAENRGKAIFFGQHEENTAGLCGTCHLRENPLAVLPAGLPPVPQLNTALFQSPAPTNNGLLDDEDIGFGEVSGRPQDIGLFKTSSLRNVELSPPYMHDGRFDTLEEVVHFYNAEIEAHPNLHPILREPTGGPPGPGPVEPRRLNLSDDDEAALVAFLKTLTDTTLATDERWQDPFPAD